MIECADRILFQGDSITDCGRDRAVQGPNEPAGLGGGYALPAAGALLADFPGHGLAVFNRGVGGDRVTDLVGRWEADAVALKPTVVSVLIGVNDTWHGQSLHRPERGVPVERYAQVYRELLARTREALPGAKLVLGEPFVLPCGAVTEAWLPEMRERQAVVRELAEAFGARFVGYQAMFDAAMDEAEPAYWAEDGVHPTLAGHARMARAWLEAVGVA